MVQIQDCRDFNPQAVCIAQDLGSSNPVDYRRIEQWLTSNSKYSGFHVDTLVELFDREVGIFVEDRPRQDRC